MCSLSASSAKPLPRGACVYFDIHATTLSLATSHETSLLHMSSASPFCSPTCVMTSPLHSAGHLPKQKVVPESSSVFF